MYIGNLMLLALNLPLIGMWVRLLKVPYHYLAFIIFICCIIGAYSIHNTAFDVGTMMVFGVIGYVLRKYRFPVAPLVLAIILGRMLERSFVQALQMSAADLGIFIQKPISAAFLGLTVVVMVVMPTVRWLGKRLRATSNAT
jgi:putative tricarboxylic transport membrane protein